MKIETLFAPIHLVIGLISLGITTETSWANPQQELLHKTQRPNVLLIITDEHNFRTLGCYRETMAREQAEMWGIGAIVETPNLDKLAKDGLLCTRAYATSPVCSPCRAALITGRYPHATGVSENNKVLDTSIPTLADRLGDAGYRTGFIGKWHLAGTGKPEWSPEVDGGFQDTRFMFNRGHWKSLKIENGQPEVASEKDGRPDYGFDKSDRKAFATDWLTDRMIEFIGDSPESQPFLAVLSYPDPHGPNTVREPYDQMYDSLHFAPPRTYGSPETKPQWAEAAKHPVFRGANMSKYFGMVKCIDDNIGRLVKHLEEIGQLENTLIIMTSDHGDLCYEHDRQNKGNPYEGSARVPLIVRYPSRIPANTYYTQPVGSVDLTPTVIGLLDLPPNAQDQGRNLSQQFSHKADDTELNDQPDLNSQEPITFLRIGGETPRWIAAIDERYKLVISINDIPWLFDTQQDPDELINYFEAPKTFEISRRLAQALKDYGVETDDPHLNHPKIAESIKQILARQP